MQSVFLFVYGLIALSVTTDALSPIIELEPDNLDKAPLLIDIRSVHLPSGNTQFTATIAEKGAGTLDSHPPLNSSSRE
jgi:hypothetical protein